MSISEVVIVFHQEELVQMSRSEQMKRQLEKSGQEIQSRARERARVDSGRMRQDIGYYVGSDSYGAYVDVFTSAARRGFRYGAYWNAIDRYLDDAAR